MFEKNPDIIVCMGDYDNGKVLRYLSARAKKIGIDLQLGREGSTSAAVSQTTKIDKAK
jgi:DNA polymerase elongation subunit (family B)